VKGMQCLICKKELKTKEATLCKTCLTFFKWKYKSLENFRSSRHKALKANGGNKK